MNKKNKILLSVALIFAMCLSLCLFACDLTEAKLLSLELVGSMKTTYFTGESLDFKDAKLKLVYEDKEIQITPDASYVTGFDTATTGEKALVIAYGGVRKTVNYTVKQGLTLGKYYAVYNGLYADYSQEDEELNATYCHDFTSMSSISYYLSDTFEGFFSWRYEEGATQIGMATVYYDFIMTATNGNNTNSFYGKVLSATKFAVRNGTNGANYIVLAHESVCDNLHPERPLSVELVGSMKTTYHTGENIDFQEAKLNLVYGDRTVEITPDASYVTGFDTTTTGNKALVITYGGVKRTVNYTVKQGIALGAYYGLYSGVRSGYSEDNEALDTSYEYDFTSSSSVTYYVYNTFQGVFSWRYEEGFVQINGVIHQYDLIMTLSTADYGTIRLYGKILSATKIMLLVEATENCWVIGHESISGTITPATPPENPFVSN